MTAQTTYEFGSSDQHWGTVTARNLTTARRLVREALNIRSTRSVWFRPVDDPNTPARMSRTWKVGGFKVLGAPTHRQLQPGDETVCPRCHRGFNYHGLVVCDRCHSEVNAGKPAGPSQADIDSAVKQLQGEMESPAFAAALEGIDHLLAVQTAAADARAAAEVAIAKRDELCAAIRSASRAGVTYRQLAGAIGISHQRIAQLAKLGRRSRRV